MPTNVTITGLDRAEMLAALVALADENPGVFGALVARMQAKIDVLTPGSQDVKLSAARGTAKISLKPAVGSVSPGQRGCLRIERGDSHVGGPELQRRTQLRKLKGSGPVPQRTGRRHRDTSYLRRRPASNTNHAGAPSVIR
jgi:hypothetical protein